LFKTLPLAFAISTSFILTGCLEVEDNNTDDNAALVAALEEQNKILAEQVANTTGSITLSGNIADTISEEAINGAVVRYKLGNEWSEKQTLSANTFDLKELPGNSDFVIEISSESNEFLTRAYYGTTTNVNANQDSIQQLGSLFVTEGEVVEIEILNELTNSAIKEIEISYNNSVALNYNSNNSVQNISKEHTTFASFNTVSKKYDLVIPKAVSGRIKLETDIDSDGINDYDLIDVGYYNYDYRSISFSDLSQDTLIYAQAVNISQNFEIRVNVINTVGNVFEGLELFASNKFGHNVEAVIDEETKQYIFNYSGTADLTLNMPSFVSEDQVNYRSAYISIDPREQGIYVNTSNFRSSSEGMLDLVDNVLNLTVIPYEASTNNSSVQLLTNEVDENDNSLNLFFNSAVEVIENEITLKQKSVFKVIKGNDSSEDLVPEGTTTIDYVDKMIDITVTNKYNNTFVEAIPITVLEQGNYRYQVGNLKNQETDALFNVDRSYDFEVEEKIEPTFSIEDITFDNNNGLYQNQLIKTHNTAGISALDSETSNYSRFYFPESIKTLEHLEISIVNKVLDGESSEMYTNQTIVKDGNPQISLVYTVSAAINETIKESVYRSVYLYTNLPDGKWYIFSEYNLPSSDDVIDSENSVTINYLYQVKGSSEVKSGTTTLKVN